MELLSTLMQKEIINTKDGSRLGYIENLEIDFKTGKINTFIVRPEKRNFGIFKKEEDETKIDFKDIKKIGEETILVEKEIDFNE